MALTLTSKLYVQFAPDAKGIQYLTFLQSDMGNRERPVPEQELHITVVHIGSLARIASSIQLYTHKDIDTQLVVQQAALFARELEAVIRNVPPISLHPLKFSHFGKNAKTLVMEFQPNPELTRIHANSLVFLRHFIYTLGVKDVFAFMQQDENLRNALVFKPHVSIAKSASSVTLETKLVPISITPMPVVYSDY